MARPDFGALGADHYRGSLAVSWGAALVEPGPIRRIREAAASRLIRVRDLAAPKSGIPPRAVKYFAVEEVHDDAEFKRHEIHTKRDRERLALVRDGRGHLHVVVRESLKPLVRQPADFKGRIRYPEAAGAAHLFYVHDTKDELTRKRLKYTLEYIEYGSSQDVRPPTTSRCAGGVPSERAQTKVRAVWYAVPTMPTGPGRIVWTKRRGNIHYVAQLPQNAVVLDNFFYSEPPGELPHAEALAAVANLSFAHLMAEVFGRRAAGDGVLHTYIRELNRLPILNQLILSSGEAEELAGLFDPVASRPQQPLSEELQQADRQAFDLFGLKLMLGDDAAESARVEVSAALGVLAIERAIKAASGRARQQRAIKRQQFDPAPIAAKVLEDAGAPPTISEEVAEFGDGLGTLSIEISEHERAQVVSVGESLLDEGVVLVNGAPLLTAPSAVHAMSIAAAMRVDPDLMGPLVLPERPEDADEALRRWEMRWRDWRRALEDRIEKALPGARYATRRTAVLGAIGLLGSVLIDAGGES